MKQAILIKVFLVTAVSLANGSIGPASAQRGGHAMGGGFHGGGFHGGGGFRGGGHGYVASGARFSGGYRAGYRGGYYGGYHGSQVAYSCGWHGGYWGYPRYRYGWGWRYGIGFGWPYGPAYTYPYAYPYAYYWGAPYPYYYPYPPYYAPPYTGYPYGPRDDDGSRSTPREGYVPQPDDNASPGDPDSPTRETAPDNNYVSVPTIQLTAFRTAVRATSQATSSAAAEPLQMRPEVLQAIRALREMPPYARQREIDHGRYRNFSAEEKELLRSLR